MKRKGPIASGYRPSRDKYQCPVKMCKSEIRGDDIPKHFQTYSNLLALDKANENQSVLRKNLTACDITEQSEEYLNGFLLQASESEKSHTMYLFHHGFSSLSLPNFNSINSF